MAKSNQSTNINQQHAVTVHVPFLDVPEDESSYALSYRGLRVEAGIPQDLAPTWRRVVYALRMRHATLPNGKHIDTGADAIRWLLYEIKRGGGDGA